ncbi:MAG: HNH endonuclease, partial [candidate division Zixibacteria bacterium]|nr:HNH endonuclease [candidate division Zixibacteria bacterium]
MDLITQRQVSENFITPSFELVETFNRYWQAVMPLGKTTSMAYPFFYLQSDGFWHLVPKPGRVPPLRPRTPSMAWIRENLSGARMDEDLFVLMLDSKTRESLRAALVQTYFAPSIQPVVVKQGFVNVKSYAYAKALLTESHEDVQSYAANTEELKPVRDQGFRKAIVQLYDHRCALCGIRMLTPEGHTVVEAAHIVPWAKSKDDKPANGLCLCRICHWSFDEGLMSVGKDYEVLVSKRVQSDRNIPGHIQPLIDRPIFKPVQE